MKDTDILQMIRPYTLCDRERILNVLDLVERVANENIPGDFVEAGVYKGGILMAMALKSKELGLDRHIYAYDTFTGMTPPTAVDVNLHNISASDLMNPSNPKYSEAFLCKAGLEEVKANLEKTNYPNVTFCVGDITKVDPKTIPNQIALLRLDTDWYDSTKFELEYFEPHVPQGGYVIVDDYGHWRGSKKAVDEFLQTHPQTLQTVDYTARYWKKV